MNNIEKTMNKYVAIQSDTGTVLERDVEEALFKELSEIDYFKAHPEYVGLQELKQETLGRRNVYALYKGGDKNTVILMHHHDVVDIECYGDLKDIAFKPEELKEALKKLELSHDATEDLGNDDWIFCRGGADMKAGLAIELEMLKYAIREKLPMNLLFLSVSDEERLSTGMRSAFGLLKEFKEKEGLHYTLLINTEPHERPNGKYRVYGGSIGKLMLQVYVGGKKSHIGKALEGFNPLSVLSRLVSDTELSMHFTDSFEGERSVPPTWGFLRDFKSVYDASIPERAGSYMSFLTFERSPKEILDGMKTFSEKALQDAISHYNETCKANGVEPTELYPGVYTFEDLKKRIDAEELKAIRKASLEGRNVVDGNMHFIASLTERIKLKEPFVVLTICPPFYPAIRNEKEDPSKKLEDVELVHYFQGISDMSYMNTNKKSLQGIDELMPLWDEEIYSLELNEEEPMLVLNVGPWGKDLHQLTERVYRPDLERSLEYVKTLSEHYAK
ncbi:M20/M25/M40 family metallo-hydrolase [Guggenheimella bovis]